MFLKTSATICLFLAGIEVNTSFANDACVQKRDALLRQARDELLKQADAYFKINEQKIQRFKVILTTAQGPEADRVRAIIQRTGRELSQGEKTVLQQFIVSNGYDHSDILCPIGSSPYTYEYFCLYNNDDRRFIPASDFDPIKDGKDAACGPRYMCKANDLYVVPPWTAGFIPLHENYSGSSGSEEFPTLESVLRRTDLGNPADISKLYVNVNGGQENDGFTGIETAWPNISKIAFESCTHVSKIGNSRSDLPLSVFGESHPGYSVFCSKTPLKDLLETGSPKIEVQELKTLEFYRVYGLVEDRLPSACRWSRQ